MDHQEKIQQLRGFIESDPGDALAFFLLGRELMEVSQFEEAASILETAVRLNPHHTAAYRFLGDAHRLAANISRAREVYEAGIAVADRTGDIQAGKEMQVFLRKLGKI